MKKDKPKELTNFCKFGELIKLEKMLCGDISQTFKASARKQVVLETFFRMGIVKASFWKNEDY